MLVSQATCLETRARWRRWLRESPEAWRRFLGSVHILDLAGQEEVKEPQTEADRNANLLRTYNYGLTYGETYFMNHKFCDLVDHARLTVPDDLAWEETWLTTPAGFLWLEEAFKVPCLIDLELRGMINKIKAIAWFPVSRHAPGHHGTFFMTFLETPDGNFSPWSYFTIHAKTPVGVKIAVLEKEPELGGGAYYGDGGQLRHEARWIYTAFYLMAQRLTHHAEQRPSSLVRSMAARKGLKLDDRVRVVSLRRMEADRPTPTHGSPREWEWQWIVRGHWRQQWYASEQLHRPVFVEAYTKGPEDKPLKPVRDTLFKAVR